MLKILLVEDNADTADLMTRMLRRHFCVTLSVGQTDAMQQLDRCQFDAIVSDMNFADGDGKSLIRSVRSGGINAATQAIAVSGDALQEDVDAAIKAGFNFYFTKPLDFNSFLSVLKTLTRRSSAEELQAN